MLGTFITKDGSIFIKGRSVKNKPTEPMIKHVGLSKQKYLKTLLHGYRGINFTDVDIIELSELSLKQWVHRKYPIPDGYTVRYGKNGSIFRKITREEIIKNRYFSKK